MDSGNATNSSKTAATRAKRDARIRDLYEAYIFLNEVRATWAEPITEQPRLEPCFAAGMQGVELAFMLLAHFLSDSRQYVVKRPRVEMLAQDVQHQFELLAEVIDGELEDESMGAQRQAGTLLQAFPFEGAPPTMASHDSSRARQSAGLALLLQVLPGAQESMAAHEKQSLRKVVRNLTGTFSTCFGDWSLGLGIEEQLSALRECVGLPPMSSPFGRQYLDYTALVRSEAVVRLFTEARFRHKEDLFFRVVHLGTECWSFVALNRLEEARAHFAHGSFYNASSAVRVAARIFDYLGDHVMLLTGMVLVDYLELKTEIEGTSGAGSVQVKQFRPTVQGLLAPCLEHLMEDGRYNVEDDEEAVCEALVGLYEHPKRRAGLFNFVKSLETVESSLNGFFHSHFLLANHVIGTEARGTMKMSVKALAKTFSKPIFPQLDAARHRLGVLMDERLAHLKGRIMAEIEEKQQARSDSTSTPDSAAAPSPPQEGNMEGCMDDDLGDDLGDSSVRAALFGAAVVPSGFAPAERAPLAFLDHAWGKTPPVALYEAMRELYRLFSVAENATWDEVFGRVMPEAASHVRRMLALPNDSPVEFGHNSHELVTRLLSEQLETPGVKLQVLTSDLEFYSATRQFNRLQALGQDRFVVECVPAEPVDTFLERFEARATDGTPWTMVYVSQITYLTQQTLVPDVAALSTRLCPALRATNPAATLVVDGYHGFGAIPTDLSACDRTTFYYVSGFLKHVASGANACFMVLPAERPTPRPLFTGWLADPTVLAPGTAGIGPGSEVHFAPGVSLMGGTPAFGTSLVIFVHVMRLWREKGVTVPKIHDAVVRLQDQIVGRLVGDDKAFCPFSVRTLVPQASRGAVRSHTLVFRQRSPAEAKVIVERLANTHNIAVDARKEFVRVGFGPYHSQSQVRELAAAMNSCNNAACDLD